MKRVLRADRILAAVTEETRRLDLEGRTLCLKGLETRALAEKTGVAANNASMELNRLYRDGTLLKIGGRPVCYLDKQTLQSMTGRHFPTGYYDCADALFAYLREPERPPARAAAAVEADSRFDTLIGLNHSLAPVIRQAKAAVTYPPHGLHTLITGPTGVGKSLFAQCMHDYARSRGLLETDAKMITLNCANYAENPQLLLSQLFGYAKGAFTGADRERKGMVEYADKGILFLDEIHRLNPEGQEKMFRLIDYGKYSRLGETGEEHTARVLIIGATTEDVPRSMLNTFLRRIPVHIELPALGARSVEERLELILYNFWKESQNIQTRIEIDLEILNALCFYDCPANLGQLATDIKITCSNAYFEHMDHPGRNMVIKVHHLNLKIIQGLFVPTNNPSILVRRSLRRPNAALVLDGGRAFSELCREYLSWY